MIGIITAVCPEPELITKLIRPFAMKMSPCLPCQPAEDLRKGGFPRAVLPRYGGHFALWNGQRNILKNNFSAYSFREPCCLQDGRAFVQYGGSGKAHSLARRAQTHVQNVLLRQKKQILRCILGRYGSLKLSLLKGLFVLLTSTLFLHFAGNSCFYWLKPCMLCALESL